MRIVVSADGRSGNQTARAGSHGTGKAGLLMAVLMLSTGLGTVMTPTPVIAQSSATEQSYSIPAQSLSSALIEFSNVSRINLFFDQNIIGSLRTAGLRGRYTPESGLAQLLAGSGLTYRFNGANSVTISDRVAAAHAQPDGTTVLDPISVTAGVSAGDAPFETAGSSAYISAEQIERFPPAAPGDLFRSVPGVMATANRAGTKLDVNIRGLQGMNRVGITLDGAMQSLTTYRGYQGAGSRVYLDPELIGGIDITKGPGDGSQAPGAIGGTVAMHTLNADDILLPGKEFGARLRTSTASNMIKPVTDNPARTDRPLLFEDLYNATGSAAFAMKKDGFEIVLAGSRRREGNYFAGKHGPETYLDANGDEIILSPAKRGQEVYNTSQDTKSALAKLKWSNEEHAAEASYMYYESTYGENMATALTYSFIGLDGVRTYPMYFEKVDNHKRVDTFTARYGWSPVDNDLIDVRVRAWGTNISIDDVYDSSVKMYGGEIKNTSVIDTSYGPLSLDYGVSASFEEASASPYSYSPVPGLVFTSIGVNGRRNVGALYANAEWKPNDWLTLAGGLRWELYETRDTAPANLAVRTYPDLRGSALSPRASVIVEPWQGIQFFSQYEQGVRPPSLYENSNNPNVSLVPNPDLKPETAHNVEVGVNVMRNGLFMPSDSFRMKAAYFHNDYDDYLSRVPLASFNMQIQNIRRARFSGVELTSTYDTGGFFAEASANYYNKIEFCYTDSCSSVHQTDYATNHIPPKVTTSVTLGMRLFEEKLVVGARASYFGKRALPIVPNPAVIGTTSPWAPYTLVDAFASYEFTENLRADLAVDNVFDRYYVDALNNLAQPGPGRTARLSFTGKF